MGTASNWQRENLAWAAGIFEGEGSISLKANTVQLQISMSDEDVVRKFASLIGLGKVHGPYKDRRKASYKPLWRWTCSGGQHVQAALAALWCFLGSRRRGRAEEAIKFLAARKPHGSYKTICYQGHPLSGSNLYAYGGKRACRICRRANSKESQRLARGYYERRAAQ